MEVLGANYTRANGGRGRRNEAAPLGPPVQSKLRPPGAVPRPGRARLRGRLARDRPLSHGNRDPSPPAWTARALALSPRRPGRGRNRRTGAPSGRAAAPAGGRLRWFAPRGADAQEGRFLPADAAAIRLLALDLDGTLVKDGQGVTPGVRAAVRAAQNAGIQVTIATGRMYRSARRFAAQFHVQAPIICYQGALVRNPISGATLLHAAVPGAQAMDAVAFARQAGVHVNAFLDDKLYMEADTPEGQFYAGISHVPITYVDDLRQTVAGGATKLVFVTDEPEVPALLASLRQRFGARAQVTRSHPRFAEIVRRGVNKGRALAAVADGLGLRLDQTMAIGDNLNDLELVTTAGIGVAMADGDPRVLAAADWTTGAYEDDGAAQAIERLLQARAKAPP